MLLQNNTGPSPALRKFISAIKLKLYQAAWLLFCPLVLAKMRQYNLWMDFSGLPLGYEGKVEAQHLDFLGHMNVMWYTHIFDLATWGFYEGFGFGREYHQGERGSFALEMYTRYLAEVRLGEGFRIYTRAIGRSKKLFHFIHFMVREQDGELAATSEMLGIHIDMRTRRSNEIPAELGAAWDRLIAEHNALGWDAPLSGAMGP